jgi:indolepyruvate ferredoxin oxidoreductase beta subunit
MPHSIQQQMIISGVGGQGVLFVTRLLAEAAIRKGLPVFTSETHGMAQRGGTVLSHLKVGHYSSPLIRPSEADGILALKAENMAQHRAYLKSDGWAVVNSPDKIVEENITCFCVNADEKARMIKNTKAVNLITLGFALSVVGEGCDVANPLFCSLEDIFEVVEERSKNRQSLLDSSIQAIKTGFDH